jgi:hypothetical protein
MPTNYPQAAICQIEQPVWCCALAQNIVTAGKRRKETQMQWAQRLHPAFPAASTGAQ